MTIIPEELGNAGLLIIAVIFIQNGTAVLQSNFVEGAVSLIISVLLLIIRAYLQKNNYNIGKK